MRNIFFPHYLSGEPIANDNALYIYRVIRSHDI